MTEYPRVVVHLDKIKNNVEVMTKLCKGLNIDLVGITKVFSGSKQIAKTFVDGGVKYLGDSRVENLKEYEEFEVPKIMIRLPMKSQIKEVVKYVDISLNSELDIISMLNEEAKKQYRIHRIILMLELGDLREGILTKDVKAYMDEIVKMKNIKVEGVGVNLTCYGGVIPTNKNLSILEEVADFIEKNYKIKLSMVSGGNSSSLHVMMKGDMPLKVNNLRLGEALIFGTESAYGKKLEGCSYDTSKLEAEIIELKEKDSYPIGEIGVNAFGEKPVFKDMGKRKRAIVAIGMQDVNPNNLKPLDKNVVILGASSDHMVLDVTESQSNYKVGDIVEFSLNYVALLQLSTSPYVKTIFS